MASQGGSVLAHVNGRPAAADDLVPLAFAGYAHFTAMQVRGRRVRGLDLHLKRLDAASRQLFGHALDEETVRARLRAALAAGPADMSLVATMYARQGEFTVAATQTRPELLIRTSPAETGPAGPLDLAVVAHERFMPGIKHVGEGVKTYALKCAAARGCDDAAFTDRQGRISEATIWNLAFWDGEAVVWPRAAMLEGTMMGIVQRQLAAMAVPQRTRPITQDDWPSMSGAVVMNSWTPGVTVRRLGEARLPQAPDFLQLLHRAFDKEPPVAP